jgi:hypothetical protein
LNLVLEETVLHEGNESEVFPVPMDVVTFLLGWLFFPAWFCNLLESSAWSSLSPSERRTASFRCLFGGGAAMIKE